MNSNNWVNRGEKPVEENKKNINNADCFVYCSSASNTV